MQQNLWHFWYSAIAIAITATLTAHANLDSYSYSTAPKDISPIDATIDSFKSGAARALKASTPQKGEIRSEELVELSTPEPKKKSRFKTFFGRFFDPNKKKKTLRNMNFAELEAFKEKCLTANDPYNAIRTLERMVPICTDLEKLKSILLELANLLFEDGKLEAAGKMYREFVKYYPGNEKVEYALYKAVVCKFYVILDAERDQTSTRDAVELANKFLEREEIFKEYSQEVRTMRERCYERLFENEVCIFNFYCDRGRYKSARTRIANIRKEFIPLIPACDPYLLTLEMQLAKQVKDTILLTEKQKELDERFPTYQHGTIAMLTTSAPATNKPVELLEEIVFHPMNTKKQFGASGEAHIARFLENEGYAIIARNYKKLRGEIDLIAQKDQELVFVEVKTRSTAYIEPEYLISPAQKRKIIATALAYIVEHELTDYVWRFDAALLIGTPPHQSLTYIENAFTQEEHV